MGPKRVGQAADAKASKLRFRISHQLQNKEVAQSVGARKGEEQRLLRLVRATSELAAPRGREEEEEEGRLHLQLETRKRVQTNEAKSKRRHASPT